MHIYLSGFLIHLRGFRPGFSAQIRIFYVKLSTGYPPNPLGYGPVPSGSQIEYVQEKKTVVEYYFSKEEKEKEKRSNSRGRHNGLEEKITFWGRQGGE